MLRKTLTILSLLALLLSGCFSHPASIPPGLRIKRIVAGATFLSKSTFFDQSATHQMNFIQELAEMRLPDENESKIAVFDQGSLWLVEPETRTVSWTISYKSAGYLASPKLVDVESDGVPEIMCRGRGFSDVGLLDIKGNLLWKKSGSYESDFTAHRMSAGDFDRDGKLEFYVAAQDGLYCFDATGLEKWRVGEGDPHWHVALFDPREKGEPQIVSYVALRGRGAPSFLEYRDQQGSLVRRVRVKFDHSFRLLIWPTEDKPLRILTRTGWVIYILDDDGKIVFDYNIPYEFGSGHGIEGTFVRFLDQEDPYLAILIGTWSAYRRTLLCIFSLDGELKYQEVLGATRGLLATRIPASGALGETLLVGDGKGKVVSYVKLP